MLNNRWPRILFLLVPLIACTASMADPVPGNEKSGKPKSEKKEKKNDKDSVDVIAVLSAGIELSWGDARRYAVASNLTGYKPLPPGIAKNLARGKPLPPGIAKTRFPSSFLTHLPAHPDYEWRSAGSDLVLVFRADLNVAGVLRDVFK